MDETLELSNTHLVIIPSYNTGILLKKTVAEALQQWKPVWVVIDGSDDGSENLLSSLQTDHINELTVIRSSQNSGKGAALFEGIRQAQAAGFTHALTMDADYQHPAHFIKKYMKLSTQNSEAMILGEPIFEASAPSLRVKGRRISNWWANLETLGWGIHDSLFGMRVYPIDHFLKTMQSTRWARRFDFDPEIAVRMAWLGVPIVNLPTPVRYILKEDGGVSQFKYGRDNVLLTWMHTRLFFGFLIRLPQLLLRNGSVE
ncbi:MAG: glycosyltransferase family 2 protein [Gammaproteobacteria bacterium]|nr:glycosyltransferase family 2 protein [Gammaproteobacteria bacterium]